MREAMLMVAMIALLMLAAALFLWQWAAQRQARICAALHVARQLQTRVATPEPAYDTRAGALPSKVLTDPWARVGDGVASGAPAEAGADAAQTAGRGRRKAVALPGWLSHVASGRALGIFGAAAFVASALVFGFAGALAAAAIAALLMLGGAFGLWWRLQKFRKQLARQLPGFIDAMVRLIAIGNSMHAAFQQAVGFTKAPLREPLEAASRRLRAGVDLDQALDQTARNVGVEELHLLASIVGLGVRYGGRAEVLLERVANFMRDREQAEHELVAMSAETRLSAWILGLLPVGVGSVIVLVNGAYFARMWADPTGQLLVFGAVGLQAFGAFLLYRLARIA